VSDYQDDDFEWNIAKSDDRMRRAGRFVERYDELYSANREDYIIATGMLGPVFISVVYVERGRRKRIVSAFEADDVDIADYMVTYAIID
jgi:hypothetical protein